MPSTTKNESKLVSVSHCANLNPLLLSYPENSCSKAGSFILSLLFKNFTPSKAALPLQSIVYLACVFSLAF